MCKGHTELKCYAKSWLGAERDGFGFWVVICWPLNYTVVFSFTIKSVALQGPAFGVTFLFSPLLCIGKGWQCGLMWRQRGDLGQLSWVEPQIKPLQVWFSSRLTKMAALLQMAATWQGLKPLTYGGWDFYSPRGCDTSDPCGFTQTLCHFEMMCHIQEGSRVSSTICQRLQPLSSGCHL